MTCPHCQKQGHLIRHGYLYGYAEHSPIERTQRAKRIFCSNRGRHTGCGRTFALYHPYIIPAMQITTLSLWLILWTFIRGLSLLKAAHKLQLQFHISTLFRYLKRFRLRQSFLRQKLFSLFPIPPNTQSTSALLQTLEHFQYLTSTLKSPFAAFQLQFQTALL